MSAKTEKKEKEENKKLIAIIIIVLGITILALGTILLIVLLNEKDEAPYDPIKNNMVDGKLKYDEAAIVLDPDELEKEVNDLFQKTEEGYITLSHKNIAVSNDGENFECYIMNSIENKYDLYINIYKDNTAQEQLLLTGLIAPGKGIDHFKSEIKLDPGNYKALLVLTQVEDDHETLHGSQLFLALDLIVNGQ